MHLTRSVVSGFVYLTGDLSALLESDECLDSETRLKYLNLLKMSTYVLCKLAEAFEDAAQRPADIITTGKVIRGHVANTSWYDDSLRKSTSVVTSLSLSLA